MLKNPLPAAVIHAVSESRLSSSLRKRVLVEDEDAPGVATADHDNVPLLAQAGGAVSSDVGGAIVGGTSAAGSAAATSPAVAASAPALAGGSGWLLAGGVGLAVGVGVDQRRDDDKPDTTAPTLRITDTVTAAASNGAVVFTFEFSEPVSGFSVDDIVVSGGSIGTLAGSGATYTVTVTPGANSTGTLAVSVAAAAARDAAGNASLAAQASQGYDTVAPTLAISDDYSGLAVGDIVYTFRFSEPVSGFTADDIAVVGGSKGALSGDGTTFTMTVTPAAASIGQVSLSVVAGGATDAAGNGIVGGAAEAQAFNTSGRVQTGFVVSELPAAGGVNEISRVDGGIVLVGPTGLARFRADGTPDSGLDGDGLLPIGQGHGVGAAGDILLSGDGKMLVVGTETALWNNENLVLARYNADGSPDTSFDGDGVASQHFAAGGYEFHQLAAQPDGKVLVVGASGIGGNEEAAISRFNADGTLDTSFSGDGLLTLADPSGYNSPQDIALLGDGRMLLLTSSTLTRLNADGSPDITFSGDGTLDFALEYVIRNDGSIEITSMGIEVPMGLIPNDDRSAWVLGRSPAIGENMLIMDYRFAVDRYLADGSRDLAFSGVYPVLTPITPYGAYLSAVGTQHDGKLLAAGWADFSQPIDMNPTYPRAALVRYNADGSLDTTFSGDGKVVTDFFDGGSYPDHVFQQADGKIVVEGRYVGERNGERGWAVARFSADGSPDTTFFGDGVLNNDLPSFAATDYHPLNDGGFLLVGKNNVGNFALAQFNADGSPDLDFGAPAKAVLDKATVAAAPAVAPHVAGFVDGVDRLALSRLTYDQLTIADGTGTESGNAVISTNGQYLAVVLGMNAVNLSVADFMVI